MLVCDNGLFENCYMRHHTCCMRIGNALHMHGIACMLSCVTILVTYVASKECMHCFLCLVNMNECSCMNYCQFYKGSPSCMYKCGVNVPCMQNYNTTIMIMVHATALSPPTSTWHIEELVNLIQDIRVNEAIIAAVAHTIAARDPPCPCTMGRALSCSSPCLPT